MFLKVWNDLIKIRKMMTKIIPRLFLSHQDFIYLKLHWTVESSHSLHFNLIKKQKLVQSNSQLFISETISRNIWQFGLKILLAHKSWMHKFIFFLINNILCLGAVSNSLFNCLFIFKIFVYSFLLTSRSIYFILLFFFNLIIIFFLLFIKIYLLFINI